MTLQSIKTTAPIVHSKMLFELLKDAKKAAATKPKASSTAKPANKPNKDKKAKK